MKGPATRVDLVFFNDAGESWVREWAIPSEVLAAYFGIPVIPPKTNAERDHRG